jgi:hypothetical protein
MSQPDAGNLSEGFRQLYCDPAVFDSFSALHPISFKNVLPFQPQDLRMNDPQVIAAELAYLAAKNDDTKRAVIAAYVRCGLLSEGDAANVESVIDFFDVDFFDLMGTVYTNAGMFICALRWYREYIFVHETRSSKVQTDDDVYASVGYCLYALGLFAESISWTKSCLGPCAIGDAIFRALAGYEIKLPEGAVYAIERTVGRARYTVRYPERTRGGEIARRLKEAMQIWLPFQETYIDVVGLEKPAAMIQPGDYPFHAERDSSPLVRHKMNLLFATCGQADALAERGLVAEAKQLLYEAAMIEPDADFIKERI